MMDKSTKVALALAVVMGLGSFPANALEVGECTRWVSILGGACKSRKCRYDEHRIEVEQMCPPSQGIPRRPLLTPDQSSLIPGTSRVTTAP
jgi:hypothetical protein